jgi:ribosomal protein S18 acetylase RimI-like enzyme
MKIKKPAIRGLSPEDYAQVLDLWQITPGIGLRTEEDSAPGIQSFLNRNPRTCFVAEQENRILGVLLSGHDGRRGFIYHTAVKAEWQRQGLGRALAEAAEEALESEGIRKIALVAFKNNEPGNQFWEKLGFSAREDLLYRNKNLRS